MVCAPLCQPSTACVGCVDLHCCTASCCQTTQLAVDPAGHQQSLLACRYAQEVQTAEHGFGLDDTLRRQAWKLTGACLQSFGMPACLAGEQLGRCTRRWQARKLRSGSDSKARVGLAWLRFQVVYYHTVCWPLVIRQCLTCMFITQSCHTLHPGAGVVNGIDTAEWSPAVDTHLQSDGYRQYDAASLDGGKAACKAALQRVRLCVGGHRGGRL